MGNYESRLKTVVKKYDERALAVLGRIAAALKAAGVPHDAPKARCDDDYKWSLCAFRPGSHKRNYEDCVDIAVRLDEQRVYEGESSGITFSLELVHASGAVVGGFSPFNYTPEVWIPINNKEAVEKRFNMIERVDTRAVAARVRSWFSQNK